MNPKIPKVLVLYGEGSTGESETVRAFLLAKFTVELRHINDVIRDQLSTDTLSKEYAVLAIPGGFTFCDDLGAGRIYALKMMYQLKWDLTQFVARGGLVIGIGNGFQTLIQMGTFGKELSISPNVSGKYLDDWTRVIPRGSCCVWLKGAGNMDLPTRHSQGRIILSTARRAETLDKMERYGMRCLTYEENISGSEESIAGLCDPSGRIFGIMTHPESALSWTNHPDWTLQRSRASSPGQGLIIFENAFSEVMSSQ